MKPILTLSLFIVIAFNTAIGQVKTNFNNPESISAKGKFNKDFRAKNAYVIPARDIKALVDKEALDNASGVARPFMIAEAVSVDIDVTREAVWFEDNEFAYGKFSILAAGAKSISANFDQFNLPKGAELYVYSDKGEMITGPVTDSENSSDNFWGTWVYKGNRLTIDFKIPIESKSNLKLHLSNIGYGYKSIYRTEVGGFGESSACNINVLCALGNGWEMERNSVSLILNGNSTALCSGALINNTCNLNIPYLLTANHCFDADSNVGQWKFTFQAWSPTCNPSQNANGTTFNGSTLRSRSAGSDFCLVELNQVPTGNSGITYSGWSRNTVGIQNTTIIHHPAGDVMKISRDDQPPVFATFLGSQEWQLVLDQGATNGGSSGAPYYDQNHRIIAQHHGINQNNADQCLNTNKFGGRFNVSWDGDGTDATRLRNWLDPSNSGAMTIDSRAIPFATGPTLVCTTGTFTLQNQPIGSTVTWSSASPTTLTIDSNSGVATRQNGANGIVIITASVTMPGGCNPALYTFSTFAGPPTATNSTLIYPSGMRGIDPVTLCAGCSYNFMVDFASGASSYTWVLPSGFSFVSGRNSATPGIKTSTASGTYVMYSSANNTCGSSWTHNLTINISGGGGQQQRIAVYPNPTSTDLIIASTQSDLAITDNIDNNEPKLTSIEEFSAKLLDQFSSELRKGTSENGKVVFDVRNIKKGIYYLHVIRGQELVVRQILIDK